MSRCAVTTIGSLKKSINDVPDDYIIGTNQIGNLSICKMDKDGEYEMIGYIELVNMEFFDMAGNIDCELQLCQS